MSGGILICQKTIMLQTAIVMIPCLIIQRIRLQTRHQTRRLTRPQTRHQTTPIMVQQILQIIQTLQILQIADSRS